MKTNISIKISIIILMIGLSFTSCKTSSKQEQQTSVASEKYIVLDGVLKKQGVTTYQYGTHVLKTKEGIFALRSKVLNMDEFVNQKVVIIGTKIEGYPIEGGPEFISVTRITSVK